MPLGDVEVVRAQFEATNDRDFERAMSLYGEAVELEVDRVAFLEGGAFSGRRAVGAWFGNWFASFEPGYRFEIEEIREIGTVVYMAATHGGRGLSSGAEVSGRTGYLYWVRDGKIVRVELYGSPAEALAAAERGE